MELKIGSASIRLQQGDITKVFADAIVNAANSELIGGGGVDGAIHRVGGPTIMMELNKLRPRGGLPAGSAVATRAGKLPAKHVIHAVGPVWRGGGFREPDALAAAYLAALKIAADLKAATVTLPSISTGTYGYPVEKAAPVALAAVARRLEEGPGTVREAIFVLFDAATLRAYDKALSALEGGPV